MNPLIATHSYCSVFPCNKSKRRLIGTPLPPDSSLFPEKIDHLEHQEPVQTREQEPEECRLTNMQQSSFSGSFTPPDTANLSHALRLVHCIQKERGSSCAYYANSGLFETAMHQARMATDISARLMRPYTDLPIAPSLAKIRSLIENHKNPQDSANDLIFHRIFVCFNTLISSVVHECVLKNLSGEGSVKNSAAPSAESASAGSDVHKPKKKHQNKHSRKLSTDINNHLASNPVIMPSPDRREHFRKTFVFPHSEEHGEDNGDEKTPLPKVEEMSHDNCSPPGCQEVQQLLDLLQLFVQLKESAGVERAILSSLLAFRNLSPQDGNDNHSLPSFRMLTNDLILEVENQRALYHKLEQLPSGPHHTLVLELAELSPRLKDLQQIILDDFESLQGAEYDCEAIWDMITLYVDKLHSVELLIIEDLDLVCADMKNFSGSISGASKERRGELKDPPSSSSSSSEMVVDRALEQIGNSGVSDVSHELLADIKRMPADEVKNRVVALLTGSTCEEVSATDKVARNMNSHKSLSFSVESSAAEILKQDMNKALHKSLERSPSKEWEISIYEIKFQKRLGQGASATTYLGKWTGQNVAVKVASITEFGLEGWHTEVNALQRLHHPNIIRLMGSIYNENPQTHCLVLEYCNAGDLASALRYPTPRNFFFHVSSSIANAMSYLHKRGIIHRDLKPSNCLCDGNIASGNFVVKITDFGIATEISRIRGSEQGNSENENRKKLTGETGTYRWMSPEVIRHEDYSTPADVYSFAVMMWQFVTHQEPFMDIGSVEAAKAVAIEKQRPPMPKYAPKAVVDLIETNWSDEPDQRLDFNQIAETIQGLQDSISDEDRVWLEECEGHPVYGVQDTDEMEPILQEVFAGQGAVGVVRSGNERSSSRGKKLRRSSPGHRGKSPNKKPSLLSSFFRKPSFDHGKL
mmetsp:Transcript_7594/g.13363  ORF Transcript_7594/g.13363 Transcript_7594/m.13363 type:complete len:924 (-) Transcript_7594:2193-4964(-)|eukprot:CAMPEP_0178735412 /NCGR_PEP_ID=MMETSP0744-20121128/1871_1 /TAXON_ID=913974 /ORGANISM="Nitzschia punctata, Strain CCMP561" /LENGTH=923 /DNA_ID=CAMNT_0020387773 /DNA_START=24 /DNA_END=2795 /DNA_ORIENTATION=+